MARIRTVKPELVDDETLGRCSREARLLDVWLTTQADDAGRQRGAVALVRSRCFPYDADVSLEDVDRWLDELVAIGRIRRYTAAGEAFVDRPGWHNEQKVDHPSPSRLPSWDDRDTDAARESSREPREPSPLNLGSRTTDQDVISLSDESSSPAAPTTRSSRAAKRDRRRPSASADELEALRCAWNEEATALPAVASLNAGRTAKLRAARAQLVDVIAAQHLELSAEELWRAAVRACAADEFYRDRRYGLDAFLTHLARWLDAALTPAAVTRVERLPAPTLTAEEQHDQACRQTAQDVIRQAALSRSAVRISDHPDELRPYVEQAVAAHHSDDGDHRFYGAVEVIPA